MGLGIGRAAEYADFLTARPQHADRPKRLALGLRAQRRGGDDPAPGRIIERSGGEVPAIKVAGDQHRRQRRIAPRQFGHDIARRHIRLSPAFQLQIDRHRLAGLGDPPDQLAIGQGYRTGRDRSGSLWPAGRASMWVAVHIGADRTDYDPDSTFARGNGRTLAAGIAIGAIGRAVLRPGHRVVNEYDLTLE